MEQDEHKFRKQLAGDVEWVEKLEKISKATIFEMFDSVMERKLGWLLRGANVLTLIISNVEETC